MFNNSVDTAELRRLAAAVTLERQAERRRELGLAGDNIGIFVGGLYPDKRVDFLIEAAIVVRRVVPNFELIMAGGGSGFSDLKTLAKPYPWIKVVGPRFSVDKIELMSLAKIFLMPGLVGLAVLDAAVLGLPIVTTAFPWHSPEIAYVKNGANGVIVADWEDAQAYAAAVIDLLVHGATLSRMKAAATTTGGSLTIEAMTEKFAEGVAAVLRSTIEERV